MTEKFAGKIYRATIYLVDGMNFYDWEDAKDLEAVFDRTEASPAVFDFESAPIEWHDDIDINRRGASKELYAKYFKVNPMTKEDIERELGYKIELIERRNHAA